MRRAGQYICAATSTGSIQLLDPKTTTVLKTWKAHSGWISDIDANSSFLVSCGWSPKQGFGSQPDPLVKVFDLKTLVPLAPIQFHAGGAAYVRLHPRMLTTCMIASRTGQLQTVDLVNSGMINVRHISLVDAHLVGMEIAPSGEAFALADSSCLIQLWGSPSQVRFTNHSEPTEFADAASLQHPELDWLSNKPLSSIGMPFYREALLSAWPAHMIFDVGGLPSKIDPEILNKLSRTDTVAYAPNPRKTRRNQALDTRRHHEKHDSIEGPKFLSEQAKDREETGRRMSEVLDALAAASVDNDISVEVPLIYKDVEIQYSRFGVDDFDFGSVITLFY